MKLYNESDIEKWVSDHLNGLNANKIAKKYGCNQWTVESWLKRRGIFNRATKKVNEFQKFTIFELYKQKHSTREVAKKINFSPQTVSYWLNKNGLIRSKKDSKILHHYRDIRPLALTLKLAFFLGIHTGDGSLGGGKKNLTCWRCFLDAEETILARKIVSLVTELFKSKPKIITKENCLIIKIFNKCIRVTLRHYGFPQGKKSCNVKVPATILESSNSNIIFAFLSGLLATDGCIYVSEKRYINAEFSTSSKLLAEDIKKLLTKVSINTTIRHYNCKNSYSSKEKYKVPIPQRKIKYFLSKLFTLSDKHIRKIEEVKNGI